MGIVDLSMKSAQTPNGGTPAQAPSAADTCGPVVKSAGRVLQILEFFDGVQREACVTEICRALSYPQSSTSTLLRSLVSMGYLQYDRRRRTYFPTRRVSLLGNWVDPSLVQRGSLLAMADTLAGQVAQAVVMATLNGLYAQYIYVSRGKKQDDAPPLCAIGDLRSLPQTAVGRALLATSSDDRITGILRRINAERPLGQPAFNVAETVAELKADRQRGYYVGRGAAPDQSGIAVIVDGDWQLLALGIEGSTEKIMLNESRLASALIASARRADGVEPSSDISVQPQAVAKSTFGASQMCSH